MSTDPELLVMHEAVQEIVIGLPEGDVPVVASRPGQLRDTGFASYFVHVVSLGDGVNVCSAGKWGFKQECRMVDSPVDLRTVPVGDLGDYRAELATVLVPVINEHLDRVRALRAEDSSSAAS